VAEMDSLTFLLIIGFVWITLIAVSRVSWFNVKNPEIGLGFAYYRTKKLNNIIQRISNHGRIFWRLLWDIGIISGLGILFIGLFIFTINIVTFFAPPTSDVTPIAVTPVIPGITISLKSLPYFIVAIMIGAIVHEFAHGIAALNENISLKSTGIFAFLLFFGAFVEPNEETFLKSSNRSKMRMMAAGGLANMLLSILIILILILPIGFPLLIAPFFNSNPSGVLVVDTISEMPANQAGIRPGYAIIGIETDTQFHSINSAEDFRIFVNEHVLPNHTLIFHFSNNIDSITLKTIPHELNQSRGYLGVLTWDYLEPRIFTNNTMMNLLPYWIFMTLLYTFMVNLMLALMNLLPIPFLDGDRLLGAFLGEENKRYHKWIKYYALLIILLNFLLSFMLMGWEQL
jgi:membrane-associated protease RseP (regulator of RpoE activity)